MSKDIRMHVPDSEEYYSYSYGSYSYGSSRLADDEHVAAASPVADPSSARDAYVAAARRRESAAAVASAGVGVARTSAADLSVHALQPYLGDKLQLRGARPSVLKRMASGGVSREIVAEHPEKIGEVVVPVEDVKVDLIQRKSTKYVQFQGGAVAEGVALEKVFYNRKVADLEAELQTSVQTGLTAVEAARRLERDGRNELPKPPPKPYWRILLRQMEDFMILLLLAVGLLELAFQEYVEGVVLVLVVVMNVIVGFVQEVKAEAALSALDKMTAASCVVTRDGERREIAASELVVGDIVALDEGAQVPADMRLFAAMGLSVEESQLTGEAKPVEKCDVRLVHDELGVLSLGDRTNMAHMSTLVLKGIGEGIVVGTGTNTQVGKISVLVTQKAVKVAPLIRKLSLLGKILVLVSLLLCGLVIGIGLLRVRTSKGRVKGSDVAVWFKVGVSLAVAVIPEGLVAVTTVSLALGVQRCSRLLVVVRNMPTLETLGSVTVICSDKTGTLTEGKMRAEALRTAVARYTISGAGIDPTGEFIARGVKIDDFSKHPDLVEALKIAAICNNSSIAFDGESGQWDSTGDPTEVALEVCARKANRGMGYYVTQGFIKLFEVPFDSDRKMMTVVFSTGKGLDTMGIVATKGASDRVLSLCTHIGDTSAAGSHVMSAEERAAIEEDVATFASSGLRTLGLASRIVSPAELNRLNPSEPARVESGMVFHGLICLRDPPREGVKDAVRTAREAGIKVIMITGDHPGTARAIASQIGILSAEEQQAERLVMTGPELDVLSTQALVALEPFPNVFARVSPTNKQALVVALKERGNIVAMTGDGVNDAPAIKHANVGIAMGKGGTDLTIQAADMVLLDDNFASIVKAVREGRVTFDGIKKFVMYLLAANSSEIWVMLFCVAVGLPVPFTPIMILWANLIVDVPPAIALGVDTAEVDVMMRKPRNPAARLLTPKTAALILSHGLSMAIACVGLYYLTIERHGYTVDSNPSKPSRSRAVAFVALASMHMMHAFVARSLSRSSVRWDVLNNRTLNGSVLLAVSLMVAACYIPGLNTLLNQYALYARDWGEIAVAVFAHLTMTELLKIGVRAIKTRAARQSSAPGSQPPLFFNDF